MMTRWAIIVVVLKMGDGGDEGCRWQSDDSAQRVV